MIYSQFGSMSGKCETMEDLTNNKKINILMWSVGWWNKFCLIFVVCETNRVSYNCKIIAWHLFIWQMAKKNNIDWQLRNTFLLSWFSSSRVGREWALFVCKTQKKLKQQNPVLHIVLIFIRNFCWMESLRSDLIMFQLRSPLMALIRHCVWVHSITSFRITRWFDSIFYFWRLFRYSWSSFFHTPIIILSDLLLTVKFALKFKLILAQLKICLRRQKKITEFYINWDWARVMRISSQ